MRVQREGSTFVQYVTSCFVRTSTSTPRHQPIVRFVPLSRHGYLGIAVLISRRVLSVITISIPMYHVPNPLPDRRGGKSEVLLGFGEVMDTRVVVTQTFGIILKPILSMYEFQRNGREYGFSAGRVNHKLRPLLYRDNLLRGDVVCLVYSVRRHDCANPRLCSIQAAEHATIFCGHDDRASIQRVLRPPPRSFFIVIFAQH